MRWKRLFLWAVCLIAAEYAVAFAVVGLIELRIFGEFDLTLNHMILTSRIISALVEFAMYLTFLRPVKTMRGVNAIILFLVAEGLSLVLKAGVYASVQGVIDLPHSAVHLLAALAALTCSFLLFGDGKKCPHCAEIIKSEANVCRYCGRDL